MIKTAIAIIAAVVIVVSGVVISQTHSGMNSPGILVYKIVGNVSNPHPYYNTTNGYVTPNLWNLQKGEGNVTMNMYSNSSILTTSNLSNVSIGYGGVIGYPSEHFTKIIGSSVQYMIGSNFSSFTSFKIVSHTANIPIDIAYDIFLAQGNRLVDEIMIYLYKANYNIGMFSFDTFYSTVIVDGNSRNISWNVYETTSTPWGGQMYAFIPNITLNNSMSYRINFSPLLKYLVNNQYVSTNLSIARFGIGSEFGSQTVLINNNVEDLADYSFWMHSYFILNGKDYQVVQPQK